MNPTGMSAKVREELVALREENARLNEEIDIYREALQKIAFNELIDSYTVAVNALDDGIAPNCRRIDMPSERIRNAQ